MKVPLRVLLFSLLLLCSCNRIHEPKPTEGVERVEVSTTEVEAGEPVNITVVLVYRTPDGYESPSFQFDDRRLVICFRPQLSEVEPSCPDDLTLPSSLTLLEGSTTFQRYRECRGRAR